ncbi:MAG: hypothetical protein NTY38_33965 [Acidobacteria bacterium]|nr:hypothetical protein [Acidobacteriota bacterium]
MILRRTFLVLGAVAAVVPLPARERTALRGKLAAGKNGKPVLLLAGGSSVALEGDVDTTGVLTDERLLGSDFEVLGERVTDGLFRVDPIHTVALFIYRDGKKLNITYWCDVCYIRTYTPSKCACCQKETDLDPRDPDEK